MKILRKIIKYILIIFCLLVLVLFATGNDYIIRGIKLTYLKGHKTANIDDYKDFDNNVVLAANAQPWHHHPDYNRIPLTKQLKAELETYQSAAFVVIKDGELLWEHYFNNYRDQSLTNSFSMAKTITTMMLGKAIEQGYIKSLNQKITDFLPEFSDDPFGKHCTVGDLSAMTSGFDWEEDYYFPLNPTAKAYYGDDIEKQMLSYRFVSSPGGHFKYQSGDTQLLAIIIQRATGKSLAQYFSDHFWKPMGMERDALWSKDSQDGMEKAYCCFNSNAKDFAKLGQLLLNDGKWNNQAVLDSAFVKKMVSPNLKAFDAGEVPIYGYSVWTDYHYQPQLYAMLGHLGQRVIVVPSEKLVIVRLGRLKDRTSPNKGALPDPDIYIYVDEVMKMIRQIP